mmetsp:Transcript_14635/g.42827  ORF Transcript_14635/g.42827 Transcript_14635/m.42827 type:complete len:249 (+) Transcript_14635:1471-2217(+)
MLVAAASPPQHAFCPSAHLHSRVAADELVALLGQRRPQHRRQHVALIATRPAGRGCRLSLARRSARDILHVDFRGRTGRLALAVAAAIGVIGVVVPQAFCIKGVLLLSASAYGCSSVRRSCGGAVDGIDDLGAPVPEGLLCVARVFVTQRKGHEASAAERRKLPIHVLGNLVVVALIQAVPRPKHRKLQRALPQHMRPNAPVGGRLFEPPCKPACRLWRCPALVRGHQQQQDCPTRLLQQPFRLVSCH